jgi:glycosyltransferase involved in cell wall biosynthesis
MLQPPPRARTVSAAGAKRLNKEPGTPRRIALLTGEYPPQPGGVGDYTQQLALALRRRGHSVATLTIQEGRLLAYERLGDGETARPMSAAGLDWSPRAWPAVITALDALRPAWLHIQYQTGAYAMAPGVNLLPWRLRAMPGRPLVAVTFHDLLEPYLFPKAGPLRTWANRRLAADADATVATNSADAAGLARLVGPPPFLIPIGSNIPVAPPPGYAPAAWREQHGVPNDAMLVAYFGLLSPSKGADLLVEAIAQLATPWRLLLIGGGATAPQDVAHAEAVRARVAALGLADRLVETGHLAAPEVSAALLAADLVALPFRDGASFRRGSLLAALAHGRPLVTTTPADPNDAALLAPAALLVPPGSPGALASALARLAADPEARARLGAAGPGLAARFSWERIAERHEELYASCPTPPRRL